MADFSQHAVSCADWRNVEGHDLEPGHIGERPEDDCTVIYCVRESDQQIVWASHGHHDVEERQNPDHPLDDHR